MKAIRDRKRGKVGITGDVDGEGGINITRSSGRSIVPNLNIQKYVKNAFSIPSLKKNKEQTSIQFSSSSVSDSLDNISDRLFNINKSISFRSEKYQALEKSIDKKDTSSEKELKDQKLEDKEELDEEKKEKQREDRREREANKEKKKKNSKIKLPIFSMPRTGIFDTIKSFVVNIIFGRFLAKMLDFAPMLKGLLDLLAPVAKFFYSIGKKILDAGATFLDFGFKAYDFTRGIVGKLTGDLGLEIFDKLSSTLTTFLNLAIVTVLAASSAALSQNNQQGIDTIRGRGFGRVKRGTVGVDAAQRYASRFGKDAAIKRFGSDAVKSLGGRYARSSITNFSRNAAVSVLGKRGAAQSIRSAAGILKPLVRNIPLIGGITEFVLSLVSGDSAGRAAFKGIGSGLGTWIGGALGSLIPVPGVGTAIGMFLGGTGGSILGDMIYNMIAGKKGPPKITTKTKARSRGGEVSDDTPEIESKEYLTPIQKPKSEGFDNEVADRISQVKYFGPIIEATSNILNIDQDTEGYALQNKEYKKIQDGLALMLRDFDIVSDKKLHEIYSTGRLKDIAKKEFGRRKPPAKKKSWWDNWFRQGDDDDDNNNGPNLNPGLPVGAEYGEGEMDLFKRLVIAEAGSEGKLGMALVARSVLNRTGLLQSGKATLGTFLAKDKTVTGVIMGDNQYQPIRDGSIDGPFTDAQKQSALEAIQLAKDPEKLKQALIADDVSPADASSMIASTGFRTGSAFNDPSQNVNVTKYKNHYFNTAGNTTGKAQKAQISSEATGASTKGMITGPAGRIGVGEAYHIDTKFHQSIGMDGMISAMDKMADAYAARGKEIVFSGQGYARLKAYRSDLDPKEKKALLNSAIAAHTHSSFMRKDGFKPFDYYIPDISVKGKRDHYISEDLHDSSTEKAEIILPDFGGEVKVGALYGGYGKSADIFDPSGRHVAYPSVS